MNKRTTIYVWATIVLLSTPGISFARFLNVDTGRFMTMDTYGGNNQDPASLHRYLYAEDEPVNLVDPSGHDVGSAVETLTAVDIGLSIAATAFVTYNAVELTIGAHNYAALTAVAQQLKIPVMQSAPEDDNQYKYFVHGTSTGAWGNSTRIDPGAGSGDFGKGFYTFHCDPIGVYWASRRTEGLTGVPFLLVVRISNSSYGGLSKLDYNDPSASPPWGQFVNDCRDGLKQGANRDVVIGPVAQYDRSAGRWVHSDDIFINQYKFEAGGIAQLQLFCILPVITFLQAGF